MKYEYNQVGRSHSESAFANEIITKKYFSDAYFGESVATLTPDLKNVCHLWNVQFKFYDDLNGSLMNNEQIAEQFGEFIKTEFVKAVQNHEAKKKKEWDEGEKTSIKSENGNTLTHLVNEKEPEYFEVKGKFTPIGPEMPDAIFEPTKIDVENLYNYKEGDEIQVRGINCSMNT